VIKWHLTEDVDDDTAREELRELSILWSEGSVSGGGDGGVSAAGGDGASVAGGGGEAVIPFDGGGKGCKKGVGVEGVVEEDVAGMLSGVVKVRELEDALAASRREVVLLLGAEKEQQARLKSLEDALADSQVWSDLIQVKLN